MEKLIIYGNGKIADITYQFLKKQYSVEAFTVDKEFIETTEIEGKKVVAFEKIQTEFPPNEFNMIIAVGYVGLNAIRAKKYEEAKAKGYSFINYVHPSVELHDTIEMGENNIILDHATVQPFVKLGNSNYIWSNAVIAHGASLEDNCWITSGAVIAGDTSIGSNCFLGINASIGHSISIGSRNFVGANALITKSTNNDEVFLNKDSAKHRLNSERFIQFAGI